MVPTDIFHRATQSAVQLNRVRCIKTQNAALYVVNFPFGMQGKENHRRIRTLFPCMSRTSFDKWIKTLPPGRVIFESMIFISREYKYTHFIVKDMFILLVLCVKFELLSHLMQVHVGISCTSYQCVCLSRKNGEIFREFLLLALGIFF